jgi:acyl carrier protein
MANPEVKNIKIQKMKKADFYTKLCDELELEEKTISEKTPFHLTSLRTLMLIAFVDENFNKRIKVVDLKEVKTIADLMNLIGNQNFTD